MLSPSRLSVSVVLVFVALAVPVQAGPLEDGALAYERDDYSTALRLFRPLAEQDLAVAQFNLGLMYRKGQGVTQDYKEAAKWYRKAADQGDAQAQVRLGELYTDKGVPQDHVTAYMWYILASVDGNENAVKNRDLLAKQMTPTQIAEAQKMAREWRPASQ